MNMKILLILMALGFLILWFLRFDKELCGKKDAPLDAETKKAVTFRTMAIVFGLALLFRVLIFLCGGIIYYMHLADKVVTLNGYLSCWNRWDAPHYLEIAQYGYEHFVDKGRHLFLVFFPLYPWAVRVMHFVCHNWQLAGILTSMVAYAVGAAFFYATLAEEYDAETAEKSLVLLSVSPFAFYFGACMTEGLFFCVLAISFYLIKKHMWLLAGVVGILCALCRMQGVIILGVGMVEFLVTYPPFQYFREKKALPFFKAFFTKAIFLFLTPLGTLCYLFINYSIEGDAFAFVKYQREHWYLSPTFFTNCLAEITGYLRNPNTQPTLKACMFLPEVIFFFLAFVALYYGVKRHPLKYTAFLFVYVMINYSVTWLISGSRYMVCALPLYVIAGEFIKRHPKAYPWVIAISMFLMSVYATGYFFGKQVM